MEEKNPATLADLCLQTLLANESMAIQALEYLPRELFISLFKAAFNGGHKTILIEIIKCWPFICLHVGTLTVQEPHRTLLRTMVETFQVLPIEGPARIPKLRILDIRQGIDCRTTCPEMTDKSPSCLYSCCFSDRSIWKREAQSTTESSESETQLSRPPMEILVDLCFDGTLREKAFFALLLHKILQSSGAVHLCCRDLQIDKLSHFKSAVRHLDLICVHSLSVDQTPLTEVNSLLSQMKHLKSLSLSKVTFRSLNGKIFRLFLTHLQKMTNLKELNLSSFCLKDHLESLIGILPHNLDFLYLTFCQLSLKDMTCLCASPQATHLKLLNISNNPMYWDDSGPFLNLLQNLSGTLQHLAINHCHITDSIIIGLIPILTNCRRLRVLSFVSNPITMPLLMRLLQSLTPLRDLKYVIYPIPTHCYEQGNVQSSLDRQKLADVQAQLKMMLQIAHREDMNWITYSQ